MFRWKVQAGSTIIEEGDWGRDIVNGVGVENVDKIYLLDKNQKVVFFIKNGVIKVGNTPISLGVNVDGYPYRFEDECFLEILELAPFTMAEYSMDTKSSKSFDRHLFVKYKVTHFIDKITRKKLKLSAPIIKSFSIRCDDCTGVSIC